MLIFVSIISINSTLPKQKLKENPTVKIIYELFCRKALNWPDIRPLALNTTFTIFIMKSFIIIEFYSAIYMVFISFIICILNWQDIRPLTLHTIFAICSKEIINYKWISIDKVVVMTTNKSTLNCPDIVLYVFFNCIFKWVLFCIIVSIIQQINLKLLPGVFMARKSVNSVRKHLEDAQRNKKFLNFSNRQFKECNFLN